MSHAGTLRPVPPCPGGATFVVSNVSRLPERSRGRMHMVAALTGEDFQRARKSIQF